MTCLIVNHWEPSHEPRKSVQRTVQRGRVPRLSFIWKERQVFLESAQGSLLLLAEGWSPGPRGSVFANQWEGLVKVGFWPAQMDSYVLGFSKRPRWEESNQKDLLGTTFQNHMGLGDPPGDPASSPSVLPPFAPPLFSALSGF